MQSVQVGGKTMKLKCLLFHNFLEAICRISITKYIDLPTKENKDKDYWKPMKIPKAFEKYVTEDLLPAFPNVYNN